MTNHNLHNGNPYQMVITSQNNINTNLLPPHNPYFSSRGVGAPSFDSALSLTPDSGLKFVDYEQ